MDYSLPTPFSRFLQKQLRGQSLTNYKTMMDIKTLRVCEKKNLMEKRLQKMKEIEYQSDYVVQHRNLIEQQKKYAKKIVRINKDKENSWKQKEDMNKHLTIAPARSQVVSANTLDKVIYSSIHGKEFVTDAQRAELRKQKARKLLEKPDDIHLAFFKFEELQKQRDAEIQRTRKRKPSIIPQPKMKGKLSTSSLPLLMSGSEYIEPEISDAPIKEDIPRNLLFDRNIEMYEWLGYESKEKFSRILTKYPTPANANS